LRDDARAPIPPVLARATIAAPFLSGAFMKHAGAAALDRLEPLLADVRALPGLREKSRGVFYWKSRPFLHFHEEAADLYADLRRHDDFERFRLDGPGERQALLAAIAAALQATGT
jgi:hypothetical protein